MFTSFEAFSELHPPTSLRNDTTVYSCCCSLVWESCMSCREKRPDSRPNVHGRSASPSMNFMAVIVHAPFQPTPFVVDTVRLDERLINLLSQELTFREDEKHKNQILRVLCINALCPLQHFLRRYLLPFPSSIHHGSTQCLARCYSPITLCTSNFCADSRQQRKKGRDVRGKSDYSTALQNAHQVPDKLEKGTMRRVSRRKLRSLLQATGTLPEGGKKEKAMLTKLQDCAWTNKQKYFCARHSQGQQGDCEKNSNDDQEEEHMHHRDAERRHRNKSLCHSAFAELLVL